MVSIILFIFLSSVTVNMMTVQGLLPSWMGSVGVWKRAL